MRVVVVPTAIDAPALGAGAVDGRCGGAGDFVALGVEDVIFDALDADRLEGAVADVQCQVGDLHAAVGERRSAAAGEMEARRWRGDRAARAREDGLIAVAVFGAVFPLDIRRQRHVADGVHRLVQRRSVSGPQTDEAPAEVASLEDLAVDSVISFKHHPRPRFQFLPRVDQRLPKSRSRPEGQTRV